jgi:hypothetical protein
MELNMTGAAYPQTSRQAQTLKVGTRMADGVIFAGIRNQTQIYTMPHDLESRLKYNKKAKAYYRFGWTFNKLAKAVKKINADPAHNYGHSDWEVPDAVTMEETLHKTRDFNWLKGTYTTDAEMRPKDRGLYWTTHDKSGSNTTGFQPSNYEWIVNLATSDAKLSWRHWPRKLSARLIRKVPVPRP